MIGSEDEEIGGEAGADVLIVSDSGSGIDRVVGFTQVRTAAEIPDRGRARPGNQGVADGRHAQSTLN